MNIQFFLKFMIGIQKSIFNSLMVFFFGFIDMSA